MKSPFALLLLNLLAVVWCTAGYAKELPNFVFIMTDDQGYDLQSDPGETKDVAPNHPEVVQELEVAIEAFQKDLDKHSLVAPFDAGQAAYKRSKEEKPSKKKSNRKRS